MSKEIFSFPKEFHWGAATASYQVEGGIENCDWAKAGHEEIVPKAGESSDHYNRFLEDFDIAKELGHNAHRFSIEWARIEPQEGKFNHDEIEHYRAVLLALRERGIEPYVTLWHFTLPLWFSENGGFERDDAPEKFARYCAFVVRHLGDLCTHFATINEPMVLASLGWIVGEWPPFKRVPSIATLALTDRAHKDDKKPSEKISHFFDYLRVVKNMTKAHNQAYRAIKKEYPDARVSIVKHTVYFHSDGSWWNTLKAKVMNYMWTYRFMNKVIDQMDEIGLNYYQHKKYGDTREYDYTDMGWQIYPEGIEGAIMLLWHYKKPIVIAEAGIADHTDEKRGDYIKKQIQGVARAMSLGADVRGHMYWSLLDNFEWALGYEKRFGLVAIDYETKERTVRPSAHMYKEIIARSSISLTN